MRRLLSLFSALLALLLASPVHAQQLDLPNVYRLHSEFRGPDECLESSVASNGNHAGASFMDACQNVTGQLWWFEHDGDEFYRMHSLYRGPGECLESNEGGEVHAGAVFMDACQDVTGQLWMVTPTSDGSVRLKTPLHRAGECLESSAAANDHHDGASFMTPCDNYSGQFWILEEVAGVERPADGSGGAGDTAEMGPSDFPISATEFVPDRRYMGTGGTHYLVFQTDGNLVVYTADDRPIWALNESGRDWRANTRAVMQSDGNLVTYAGETPIWASDTWGHPNAMLVLLEDGTLQVVVDGGDVLWSSE